MHQEAFFKELDFIAKIIIFSLKLYIEEKKHLAIQKVLLALL
jgi:hypothetical protein